MLLSHNNSFASEADIVIGDVYFNFFRLEILINFVANKKKCFLLKILSRKLSFLKKSDRLS